MAATKEKTKKGADDLVNYQPNGNGDSKATFKRIPIQKTYKLYIGGKYPRTESGRYYQVKLKNGGISNVGRSSRKDIRDAVKIARATFSSDWAKRPAFVRGHIMYRIAEMLEARKSQFVEELVNCGTAPAAATTEVEQAIDRFIYYAGWSDKYQQVFSSVNPTNTPHFNFSVFEPMGIVGLIAPEKQGVLGLISALIPIILGGNTCVLVPSQQYGSVAISLSEVFHSSDVPGGVINILTGFEDELTPHFGTHMDVNAVVYCREDQKIMKKLQEDCSLNVKRFFHWNKDWSSAKSQNPYLILDTQEVKTTWHPIGF